MNIFKDCISYLYHKYVSKPEYDPHCDLEEYLKICVEEYKISKYYKIDTYEKVEMIKEMAKVNCKIKNIINKSVVPC